MQAAVPRHVLVVGASNGVADRLAPLLQRSDFDLHTVSASDIVLDLVMGTPFELLVVGYPLPEIDFHELLRAVRLPGSASHDAGILLLARPGFLEAAQAMLPIGANRAAGLDWTDSRVAQAIDDLLHVAPRANLRAMFFADVQTNGARERYLYRTVNVSLSGVLVEGERLFAPGTPIDFAFRLPSEPQPVEGRARVVRRTDANREGLSGLGARFVELLDDGQDRLAQYVRYFNA